MRTTVRLDEKLLEEAKRYALDSGRSLTAVIEEALREKLARREQVAESPPFEVITFGGGGVCEGVDLDNSASLLDIMEDT